jgi:hypothetical protein
MIMRACLWHLCGECAAAFQAWQEHRESCVRSREPVFVWDNDSRADGVTSESSRIPYRVKAVCSAAKISGGVVHSMEGHNENAASAAAAIKCCTDTA